MAVLRRAIAALGLWSCVLPAGAAPPPPDRTARYGAPVETAEQLLRIEGATDIEFFGPLLQAFARTRPGIAIIYEERITNALDISATAACAGEIEPSDLVISSSIDQQVKLVNDGCARPHASPETRRLPDWASWRDELFGLTFEPIVIVYNRDLVPHDKVPNSRFDLIDLLRPVDNPYRGKIATYDIEASGVGYLLAFSDSQQATTFGRLIEAFGRNDVVATCCFNEIVDGVAEGKYLIAYNMFASYALARAASDPRLGVVAPRDYTLVLSRAAFIPRSAKNPDLAAAFIDFSLSAEGRRALAAASLVVSFTEEGGGIGPSMDGVPNLRPIAFSPVLLVGLDEMKRRLFLNLWHASLTHGP